MTTATINRPPMRQPAPPAPAMRKAVTFGKITTGAGHRVVLYGPGGIGKTTLACQLPGPVAFIDLDDSLSRLRSQLVEAGSDANILPVEGCDTWPKLREALQSDGWNDIKSIVIDTGTRAEELAIAHTLATIPHEKGHLLNSIEGYGFGKGFQHVYETFLGLLGDLDRHSRAGRNVLLICHDCTTNVPNPAGDDWLRYEPRLQSPNSGKASIRLRVREWADHVLFLGYDVDVTKDGKGRGCGTRTLYPQELPHCMAKSRTASNQIQVTKDSNEVWKEIIK